MSNVPPPPPPPPPPAPPPPPPFGGVGQPYGGGVPQQVQGAGGALAMAIIGLLCCGIVLGPIAIYQANGMKKRMASTPGVVYTNSGTVQAAYVIGIIATVLSVIGIIVFAAGR